MAEKSAWARYEHDKLAYFPGEPTFSLVEEDIVRAAGRLAELIRLFAEEMLDAHLKEYLRYAPSELVNHTVLQSLTGKVDGQALNHWEDFELALQTERLLNNDEPQQWFDPEQRAHFEVLSVTLHNKIKATISNRIEHYQRQAVSASKPLGEQEQKRLTVVDSCPEPTGEGTRPSEGAEVGAKVAPAPAKRPRARTSLGSNIDRLRKDCGWSFDELAKKTGIEKKLILAHVNAGTRPHPRIAKLYADAFTKALGRPISATDLQE